MEVVVVFFSLPLSCVRIFSLRKDEEEKKNTEPALSVRLGCSGEKEAKSWGKVGEGGIKESRGAKSSFFFKDSSPDTDRGWCRGILSFRAIGLGGQREWWKRRHCFG